MMEHWKDIEGYEGYYQVSDQGRVRSISRVVSRSGGSPMKLRGRVLRPGLCSKYGHVQVVLCKDGFQRDAKVHRLVLAAWVGPCPSGCESLHGPAGVSDNSVSNLSWGTRSENHYDTHRRA